MLNINNLTVKINDSIIIKNLNLTILPGQLSALMGSNGSGKSSLAYTILGHPNYEVISGSIKFLDTDLLLLSSDKRARLGVFLAFQYPPEIPGLQVFDFLKDAFFANTQKELSVPDFREQLYFYMDLLKLDHQFAYRNLHEGFSGGEKKKLELLQLLLFKPKIAILDEIDSGVDLSAIKHIADALKFAQKENPGMAIVIITHYRRILQELNTDKVHLMHQGILFFSGDPEICLTLEQLGYEKIFTDIQNKKRSCKRDSITDI